MDHPVHSVLTWQPFSEGDLDGLGGLDDSVVVEVWPERADRHLFELAAKVREELHPELAVVLPIRGVVIPNYLDPIADPDLGLGSAPLGKLIPKNGSDSRSGSRIGIRSTK